MVCPKFLSLRKQTAQTLSNFQKTLAALNPQQRRAVERIEGPVAVIAGPGTGKTQLLAARIGQILTKTDTLPQAILCLTYTDAAAHAMRERLIDMIGPDAHRVPITTFHSFCNRVIQENPDIFDRHDLEPVSDLERVEIIRRLLENAPPDHPLRRGRRDAYFFEQYLADFFSLMKRENWSPRHVQQKVQQFLAEIPTRKDFVYQRKTRENAIGDPKTDKLEDMRTKMERVLAAAELFPKYNWAMENARRYDYDDMIGWVLKKFAENQILLRNYQERYLYFLVDEFQDTNGAQSQLLNQLAEYWDAPNVFIVGDDDQSIFEFQGARLRNLLEFLARHEGRAELIVLTENYRSSQKILDISQRLIQRNEIRATQLTQNQQVTKILTAKNLDVANAPDEPKALVFENRLAETAEIARQIEALLKNGQPPESIAVIVAQHRQSDQLMALLEKKNIPFQTRRPANLLEQPLIRQFTSLIRWLDRATRQSLGDEAELFKILHFKFLGFSVVNVSKLFSKKKEGQHFRLQLIENQHFASFSKKMDDWQSAVFELPLPAFLEKLAAETGLLAHLLVQPEKIWLLECLTTLLEFAATETHRQPTISLARFCEMLDQIEQNRLRLGVQQKLGSGGGIHFLTAHGAKGLEFEHVFMLDCTRDFWENARGGQRRFALPDTLTLSGEEDLMEARRRLFYVAMTRAKRHLTISFSKMDLAGKPIEAAIFVEETAIPHSQVLVNQSIMVDAQVSLLLADNRPKLNQSDLLPPEIIAQQLADFALSISSLNQFLNCPLAFYYERIVGVPRAATESSLFGEAIHHALARFFEKMRHSKKQEFGPADELARFFEIFMEHRRGRFSATGFDQKMAHGRAILTEFHFFEIKNLPKNSLVERKFDRIELDGIPLTGTIDRLDLKENGTKIHLADYKTARPSTENMRRLAAPNDENPLGGDYWRQLVFYKILLENARSVAGLPMKFTDGSVESGSVIWLETGQKGGFSTKTIEFSMDSTDFVKNQIREVWDKIQRHEFAEGCGKSGCIWCQVHLDNRAAAAFLEADAEGLDD